MSRFLAGFGLASLLWGGVLFASARGYIDLGLAEEPEPETLEGVTPGDEADDATKSDRKKRRRAGSATKRTRSSYASGDSTSGDDLGEDDPRQMDMHAGGGEEQLASHEIEKGFDGAFSQVRRCLILAAGDEPARGKVVFGLRVAGSGKVTAVNLSGPSSVTQGESGACLRKAASSIQFRSFNGPDMVVRYPLTLE